MLPIEILNSVPELQTVKTLSTDEHEELGTLLPHRISMAIPLCVVTQLPPGAKFDADTQTLS